MCEAHTASNEAFETGKGKGTDFPHNLQGGVATQPLDLVSETDFGLQAFKL